MKIYEAASLVTGWKTGISVVSETCKSNVYRWELGEIGVLEVTLRRDEGS